VNYIVLSIKITKSCPSVFYVNCTKCVVVCTVELPIMLKYPLE